MTVLHAKLAKVAMAVAVVVLEFAYQILRRKLRDKRYREMQQLELFEKEPDETIH